MPKEIKMDGQYHFGERNFPTYIPHDDSENRWGCPQWPTDFTEL